MVGKSGLFARPTRKYAPDMSATGAPKGLTTTGLASVNWGSGAGNPPG